MSNFRTIGEMMGLSILAVGAWCGPTGCAPTDSSPATQKDAPVQDAKAAPQATDAEAPKPIAEGDPAAGSAASAATSPPANDVEGFKPDPKYDARFKAAPLTEEEKKLLERDPATLTGEERKAWSYAYRKKSLGDPNSPGARTIRQAGESILSGDIKPNLDYKRTEPLSTPPAQATE
jgi:hypothetical protein